MEAANDVRYKLGFESEQITQRIKDIIEYCNTHYQLLDYGRHRVAYRHKDYVIKVPINDMGFASNSHEAVIYRNAKRNKKKYPEYDYIREARCRLICDKMLLVMEYVKETSYDQKPDWAVTYDCFQVGVNKHGRFKAYDYGL
jgi:hypothetical protein